MGSARHNFKTVSALSSASTNKPLSISGLHKSRSLYCSFLAYSLATSHHPAPGRHGPRWRIPHMFPAQESRTKTKRNEDIQYFATKKTADGKCIKLQPVTQDAQSGEELHGNDMKPWDNDHNSIVGGSLQLGHKWMLQKVHCWLPACWTPIETGKLSISLMTSYLVTPLLHVATEVICCKYWQCVAGDWHIHQNRLMKKQR